MFSGIIRHKGEVIDAGTKLKLKAAPFIKEESPQLGDSVAVAGCCLTVVSVSDKELEFDVVSETLRATKLGGLENGQVVNIEGSLKVGDKIDGHFVLGHVDFVSKLLSKEKDNSNTWRFVFEMPDQAKPYICPKGSVCVDGVSLTVGEVEAGQFSVYIIPHTYKETTFYSLEESGGVNIEYDCLARYAANAISVRD